MKMKRFTSLLLAGVLGMSVAVALNSCHGGHHDGPVDDIDVPPGDEPAEDNEEEPPAKPSSAHPVAGKTFEASSGDCRVEITFPEELATAHPNANGEMWATGTAIVVVHGVTYNGPAYCYCDYQLGDIIWGGFELDCEGESFVDVSFGMRDDGTHSNYLESPKMEIYDGEGGTPETIMFENYSWPGCPVGQKLLPK